MRTAIGSVVICDIVLYPFLANTTSGVLTHQRGPCFSSMNALKASNISAIHRSNVSTMYSSVSMNPRTHPAPASNGQPAWFSSVSFGQSYCARLKKESALARPEPVPAYLLLLASDQAVFLEAEEGSRAYVVALGGEKELRQVSTRSIEPGTYLVIREGGEGDYIPAIADSLLGANAQELRAAQRRWKIRLQELIDLHGLRHVLGCLKEAGAVRATDMNVRRWASDASPRLTVSCSGIAFL